MALCIVGTVVVLDMLLHTASFAMQALGLLVAALVIALVQYLVSIWMRRKQK